MIGHLLTKGSHADYRVNAFTSTYEVPLRKPDLMDGKQPEYTSVQELNRLLHNAMTGSPIDTLVPSSDLVNHFAFYRPPSLVTCMFRFSIFQKQIVFHGIKN